MAAPPLDSEKALPRAQDHGIDPSRSSIKRKPIASAQPERLPQPSAPHASPLHRARTSFGVFLDKHMPAHRTYARLPRRTFLTVLLVALIALLALIIGLAVGLTQHHRPSFLPLPSDRSTFTGDLTYYGTGLGACGVTSTDSDDIVSVSHFLFDHESTGSDPNQNPLCGRIIRAETVDGGVGTQGEKKSVDLRVVDRCTGCKPTDLDVSPNAFSKLADPSKGRVTVTWAWVSAEP